MQSQECPPNLLAPALEAASRDNVEGLERIDDLLRVYDLDPRLHFLRGSMLASLQRYGEGRDAMQRAVDLAPGFAIARFQLGFLELTSGDAVSAETTWAPLQQLKPEDPLRLFAQALGFLIRDEFEPCIDLLRAGMALNTANPPLNQDMQRLIDEIRARAIPKSTGEEPASAASLLLKQYRGKGKLH